MFLMAYKNVVSVKVCGRTMTLTGNESVEYITRVANYIEEKAAMLRNSDSSKNLSATMVSVLTSINIADDYFKALEEIEELKKMKGISVSVSNDGQKMVSLEEYEAVKKQNKKLKADADELTKAVEEKVSELENVNSRLEKEVSELKANMEKVKDENLQLRLKAESLENDKKEISDKNERFVIENSVLRSEKNRLETENSSLKTESENLKGQVNGLKADDEKLTEEKSNAESSNEDIKNKDVQIEELKKELENSAALYDELNKKFGALQEDNIKKIAQINHLKSMESRFLEFEKKMKEQKEIPSETGGKKAPSQTGQNYYKRI